MNRTLADRTCSQEERIVTLPDAMAKQVISDAIENAYRFRPEAIAAGLMIAHGVTHEQAHAALCKPCRTTERFGSSVKCAVFNAFDAAFKGHLTPNQTAGL